MKKILLIVVLFATQVTMAQDVIVTKQSERIDAKILKVTDKEVEYKKQNNPDGPTFTLSTSKIATIIYKSGDVQTFNVKDESESGTSTFKQRGFQSTISFGFSMPTVKGNENYGYDTKEEKLYGGYIGYAARIPLNKFLSFRPGMLINAAGNAGGFMLDIRVPILAEVGLTFENDMGVYLCFGPQMLVGLSAGNELFEYLEGANRFDLGITVGGGFDLTSFMGLEFLYTFGLLKRGYDDFNKVNFLTAGFNFYL